MLTPLLTLEDQAELSEGSLDPMGLYSIADALAVRLVPGVRERQKHPRFLTAMAVGAFVCADFDPQTVAVDGVSEPWQVFEWYVVEGLVRSLADQESELRGVPGRDKAARAIADRVPLSAANYLKSATIFGFHGTYRRLARELGVIDEAGLDELGWELLETWADEQGLTGFCHDEPGPGREWRLRLRRAVEDGLNKAAVARGPGWSGWTFFGRHLAPYRIGQGERQVIWRGLTRDSRGYRDVLLQALHSDEGRAFWSQHGGRDERPFHLWLRQRADGELRTLLDAILCYERFSRLLQDAFDDALYEMTRRGVPTSPRQLAQTPGVQRAAREVPQLYEELLNRLAEFGQAAAFQAAFAEVAQPAAPVVWAGQMVEHHRRVQQAKPPNGKAPWFDRFDDGRCGIRALYRRDEPAAHDDSYVHSYRTDSLWQFLHDLKMVS